MIGFLFASVVALAATGFGLRFLRRFFIDFDPAMRWGGSSLIGLGFLGTATLFVGLIPGGYHWGFFALFLPFIAIGIVFLGLELKASPKPLFSFSAQSPLAKIAILVLSLGLVFALVGVLMPSTANDWDSIAYHMAVPKIYLGWGEIHRVLSIHHSNFPSAMELIFVWTLRFGQSGAKGILWWMSLSGMVALFGFARQRYGQVSGWWCAIAFLFVPTVLWESGSAYIDIAHGLYTGFGILILALEVERVWKDSLPVRKDQMILAGLFIGLSCGTKYTGLETGFLTFVVFGLMTFRVRQSLWLKGVGISALTAFVTGGAWYIKNIILVRNPVYPFAYETFGGKDWDEWRALIYHKEQLGFGVGVSPSGKHWGELGHAIFGLAYQPGRYVNPLETVGGGTPLGAVGISFFLGLLFWCFIKRPAKFEQMCLLYSLLALVMWFGLSQQSRYMTDILPLTSILAGAAVIEIGWGRLVAILLSAQAVYTLWLEKTFTVMDGLPVVMGKVSRSSFLHKELPFTLACADMKLLPPNSKVALYDQVFGYYVPIRYFWANPPNCTIIPYPSMHSGGDYVRDMKKLGFTDIYVQFVDPSTDVAFAKSLGIYGTPGPLPADLLAKWKNSRRFDWKPLLVDAVNKGYITQIKFYRFGMLFQIQSAIPRK